VLSAAAGNDDRGSGQHQRHSDHYFSITSSRSVTGLGNQTGMMPMPETTAPSPITAGASTAAIIQLFHVRSFRVQSRRIQATFLSIAIKGEVCR
jgi:hypothetical protein